MGTAEKAGDAGKAKRAKEMKIAFAIAALNEEESIGACIDSVLSNHYKSKEIIVVDGGSKDRTAEIAKKKGAAVLKEAGKNRCPANAWNQAINYTDAGLICLLGADFLLPDPDFAEKTARAFDDPRVSCVYTAVRTEEETLVEKIVSCFGMSMHPNVFRKDVVLAIGGFPVIGFGEDRIFGSRMQRYSEEHGMRAVYLNDTYYSGHAVQTVKDLYKQSKWYGRTSLLYLKEYRKENSAPKTLKEALAMYFKTGYFALFVLSAATVRTPAFYYFFLPFAVIALITLIRNTGRPYHLLKIFTNLVAGLGLFVGVISYISGLNKYRGRG